MAFTVCLLTELVASRSAPEEYGVSQDVISGAAPSRGDVDEVAKEVQYLKEKTAEVNDIVVLSFV